MSKDAIGVAAAAAKAADPRSAEAKDGAAGSAAAGRPAPPDVYVYAVSGMAERKGRIPIWLWLVALGLTIWGIYYLIAYWNPPPGT